MYNEFKQIAADGMMTADAFCHLFHQQFPRALNDDYAMRMFAAFDPQTRGYITFEARHNNQMSDCLQNFVRLVHRLEHSTPAQVDYIIAMLDPHGNGVDERQLVLYVKSVYDFNGLPCSLAALRATTRQVLQRVDADRDGRIDARDVHAFIEAEAYSKVPGGEVSVGKWQLDLDNTQFQPASQSADESTLMFQSMSSTAADVTNNSRMLSCI